MDQIPMDQIFKILQILTFLFTFFPIYDIVLLTLLGIMPRKLRENELSQIPKEVYAHETIIQTPKRSPCRKPIAVS